MTNVYVALQAVRTITSPKTYHLIDVAVHHNCVLANFRNELRRSFIFVTPNLNSFFFKHRAKAKILVRFWAITFLFWCAYIRKNGWLFYNSFSLGFLLLCRVENILLIYFCQLCNYVVWSFDHVLQTVIKFVCFL